MIDWSKENVFITGACGTIGSELVKQLYHKGAHQIVAIDNNETELFFHDEKYKKYSNVEFYLEDIKNEKSLEQNMKNSTIVFHVAAHKHVILCEKSPNSAIETNILGVSNVISAALNTGVKKVVFTSSDKAVNPTNVMGTSKLMGERLMSAANIYQSETPCIFSSTRFGNVLGSRGSVIPVFKEQIRNGGPITLTDPEMTRFIMSTEQAVNLIIDSVELSCGGEIFITKMPSIKIKDLAEVMIKELAHRYGHSSDSIKIEVIGAKAGEKLYEELMTSEETKRALELEDYFVVKPAFLSNLKDTTYTYDRTIVSSSVTNPYISANETTLTHAEIKEFLYSNKLI